MNISRRSIVVALAALSATMVVGVAGYGIAHYYQGDQVIGIKESIEKERAVELALAQSVSPSPSVGPTVGAVTSTPIPTPLKTVGPTGSPQPTTMTRTLRGVTYESGPCKGINAADDGCITKDGGRFEIASLMENVSSVTCNAGGATINFGSIMVTRHYMAGAGGMATFYIDYNDGVTAGPYNLQFTPSTNSQYQYAGLSHTFANASGSAYRIRLISPNTIPGIWRPLTYAVQGSCVAPVLTPTPTPYGPSTPWFGNGS